MRKILKGAIVLLIVAAMIFSTSAVVADSPKTDLGKDQSPDIINKQSPPTSKRALLWDNGDIDLVNGFCCQRVGSIGLADLADDFHLDKKSTIERIVWETVDDPTYVWQDTDDLIIYQYGTNGPGTEEVVMLEVSNTRELLGEQWGRPWYRYEIDLIGQGLQFELPAGDYYILLRPYSPGTEGQSFWLTSPAPAGSTSECYWRSDFFGYPTWTPATTVWGEPFDVNFKIYGTKQSAKEFNTPILDFLNSHPNLFPILQILIKYLGL
jgi:hypothetical protein